MVNLTFHNSTCEMLTSDGILEVQRQLLEMDARCPHCNSPLDIIQFMEGPMLICSGQGLVYVDIHPVNYRIRIINGIPFIERKVEEKS